MKVVVLCFSVDDALEWGDQTRIQFFLLNGKLLHSVSGWVRPPLFKYSNYHCRTKAKSVKNCSVTTLYAAFSVRLNQLMRRVSGQFHSQLILTTLCHGYLSIEILSFSHHKFESGEIKILHKVALRSYFWNMRRKWTRLCTANRYWKDGWNHGQINNFVSGQILFIRTQHPLTRPDSINKL